MYPHCALSSRLGSALRLWQFILPPLPCIVVFLFLTSACWLSHILVFPLIVRNFFRGNYLNSLYGCLFLATFGKSSSRSRMLRTDPYDSPCFSLSPFGLALVGTSGDLAYASRHCGLDFWCLACFTKFFRPLTQKLLPTILILQSLPSTLSLIFGFYTCRFLFFLCTIFSLLFCSKK